MKANQAKKKVKAFIRSLRASKKKVDHVSKVLEGFNFLIAKGVLKVKGKEFFIYREMVPQNETKRKAWINNAYIYARMKLEYPENTTIYIKDIETGDVMGVYKEGRAVAI